MNSLRCIGLMSGTSMDGIDAALITTNGITCSKLLSATSYDYDANFKTLLKVAQYSLQKSAGSLLDAKKNFSNDLLEFLNNDHDFYQILVSSFLLNGKIANITLDNVIIHSTLIHAKIVKDLLKKTNLTAEDIDLVGYHGQTLYHKPSAGVSIQVGDAQLLADEISINVINDFRSNDIKNFGQGAPLAPVYHQAIAIRDNVDPVVILNCGGIANISIITGRSKEDLIAYDSGPGNVLIDKYVRTHTNNQEFMDKDGKYGLRGKVNEQILQLLMEKAVLVEGKNYFKFSPPKSLDTSNFSLIEELGSLCFEDGCATLEAFTAYSIVDSIKFLKSSLIPKKWILAGGGWNNPMISLKLSEYLLDNLGNNFEVLSADKLGWSSKYMEAETFAFLAARSYYQLSFTYPTTTNCHSPCTGGVLHYHKIINSM